MADDIRRKQVDAENAVVGPRTVRFVVSTGSVDRDGDTIDPRGWRLDAYRRNPIVLWQHDRSVPPIARTTRVAVEGDKLVAEAEFAPGEIHPLAEQVFRLLEAGFLRATSVGFRDLLEYSVVNQPSNPDCVARSAANAAAIQKWCEGVTREDGDVVLALDDHDGREAEELRRWEVGRMGGRRRSL